MPTYSNYHPTNAEEYAFSTPIEERVRDDEIMGPLMKCRAINVHPLAIQDIIDWTTNYFQVQKLGLGFEKQDIDEGNNHVTVAAYYPFKGIVVTPFTNLGDIAHELAHHLCFCESIDASGHGSEQHGPIFCVMMSLIVMAWSTNADHIVAMIMAHQPTR